MNREILKEILGDEYEILTAEDGEEAIVILQKYGVEIHLVLLDIVMPNMDGFEVLAVMNKYRWIDDIPVVMISSENSPSVVHRAYELGVSDYISRPFDATIVHKRVGNTIMLYEKQKRLADIVADQIYEKEKSSSLMVAILSHIVEFRNGESGLHVLHINVMTKILLEHLLKKTDRYHLTYSDISLISMASALHDIGKISIPDEVLNKPGRLTKEEYEVMKTHSGVGSEILKSLPFQQEKLVRYAYDICRWHHERYDGRGYPDGLKGEEIPIWAQVVSIADVYDALTSERVYKEAYSHEKAMSMILGGECGAFNPLLLECLQETADVLREELKNNSIHNSLGNKEDVRHMVKELSRHKELAPSERAFELLDRERVKNEFFTSVSRDFVFEYYFDSDILTLSPAAAEYFGVDDAIVNPFSNQAYVDKIGREALLRLKQDALSATQKQPLVEADVTAPDGRKFAVSARAVWSSDEKPVSIIGKIFIR